MFRRAFEWYNAQLKSNPIRTNMCNGGLIMSCGDAMAQRLRRRSDEERHDFTRSAIMVSYAMFISCPFWLTFWRKLDHRWPVDSLQAAFKKSLLSWAVGGTTINTVFLTFTTTAEGVVRGDSLYPVISERVRSKVVHSWATLVGSAALFWIPMSTINFYFMPRHMRLLYGNIMAVLWNTFISYVQKGEAEQKERNV